jgi:hypothetical protein
MFSNKQFIKHSAGWALIQPAVKETPINAAPPT